MSTFVTFPILNQRQRINKTSFMCAQKPSTDKSTTKRKTTARKKTTTKKSTTTKRSTRKKTKPKLEIPELWSRKVSLEELKYEAKPRIERNPILEKLPPSNIELSDKVLTDLRKSLKQHDLITKIAEISQCETARFTGIVYHRNEITDDSPDGLPPGLDKVMNNSELAFINIPPALVERISDTHNESIPTLNLLAVFERFGSVEKLDKIKEKFARERDEDVIRQLRAWSDIGDARRTETDLTHIEGAELFREPLFDMFD